MKQAADARPRPIRTGLLVCAGSEERIEAALACEADALYLDLESVPEERLPDARTVVRRIVAGDLATGRTVLVRVNSPASGWTLDDLEAAVAPGLYGVVLPKVERSHDVVAIDTLLGFLERRAGVSPGSIIIHPLIETAKAVRRAYRIGRSSSRVAHMGGVSAPSGDLSRALGFQWTAEGLETLYVRSKVLVDARAAGVRYPLSGLAPVEDDLEELRRIALAARRLGYQGMLVGYASHVGIVNEAFTPSRKEIERWLGIVEAAARAREQGARPAFRGRRLDEATVKWVEDNLELARRLRLIERDADPW